MITPSTQLRLIHITLQNMPTDLERRLLSNLIHEMHVGQLRELVMHVAEKHLGTVGAEVLRMKEKGRTTMPLLAVAGPAATIPRRRPSVSESPLVESTSLLI
jgi:hypothetical protein